jgi:hypothetical protein
VALASAGKKQNLRINLSEAIDTLTKAGLEVMGGFIVGFDTDGPEVFEAQKKFIQESAIPLAMVGMLTALPGTQLHSRLRREGRLRREATGDQFSRPNFTPMMDERVLLEGYASLMAYLYSADAYYDRCARYVERAAAPPGGFKPNTTDLLHFARGMFKVGVRSPRRRHFWRLLVDTLRRHPAQTKWVVVHAIMGEHLIEYTEQHVIPMVKRGLASLEVEESNMIEERARMRARKRLPTVTSEQSTSCVA